MEAGALLRALNPFKFRAKFSGSYTIRCSSSSSAINIPTGAGKEMGRRAYDGLLLDAANTLLQLTKPVEETYAVIGKKYGVEIKDCEGKVTELIGGMETKDCEGRVRVGGIGEGGSGGNEEIGGGEDIK
ncbi:hypothetical protein KY285_000581 [Solanum tuberosum]|nr:hypothetical protein KY285_000581 [Solanum tuberosum]